MQLSTSDETKLLPAGSVFDGNFSADFLAYIVESFRGLLDANARYTIYYSCTVSKIVKFGNRPSRQPSLSKAIRLCWKLNHTSIK